MRLYFSPVSFIRRKSRVLERVDVIRGLFNNTAYYLHRDPSYICNPNFYQLKIPAMPVLFRITLVILVFNNWITAEAEISSGTPAGLCNTYGDITKLKPKGASKKTAASDGLKITGVLASNNMLDIDFNEISKYKTCFYEVGVKHDIHPALIAAIASRESCVGKALDAAGYGDNGKAYGIMQCDIKNSGLTCTKYEARSCQHVNMLVEERLLPDITSVQRKHPQWKSERQLQGAVAAYNFGVKNVQNWPTLDQGSTNGDYSHDIIARAQRLISPKYGWTCDVNSTESTPSPTSTAAPFVPASSICEDMAQDGNCNFYSECVEKYVSCGETGYALGYGKRYCTRFAQYESKFNNEGKEWINNVRTCLMKALLLPSQRPGITCEEITEIAFTSHNKCYRTSGVGICEVVKNSDNRDGLWTVYELKDFIGPEGEQARTQVLVASWDCANTWYDEAKQELGDAVDAVTDWLRDTLDRKKRSIESTDCDSFASSGDCRFYECFEMKFPCAERFGYSHLMDFELVHCMEFQKFKNHQIGNWMKQTEICMMSHLKDLFHQSSVSCASLKVHMYETRVRCMVESGFCSFQLPDTWMIDRGTNDHGYPYQLPRVYSTRPLSGSSHMISNNYFRALHGMKHQIGEAHKQCAEQGYRTSSSFYVLKETQFGTLKMAVDY